MDWSTFFLNPATVWVVIPITAIVICGVRQIASMHYRHLERMAMIQQGLDPDKDDELESLAAQS